VLGVCVCVCVCVHPAATACRIAALVSAVKIMRCIQCSLVTIITVIIITPTDVLAGLNRATSGSVCTHVRMYLCM